MIYLRQRIDKYHPTLSFKWIPLYKNVLLPKLAGRTVNTGEINLSAFELRDIETVCDYYENHISPDRRENKPLVDLYETVKNAPAKTRPVEFL